MIITTVEVSKRAREGINQYPKLSKMKFIMLYLRFIFIVIGY